MASCALSERKIQRFTALRIENGTVIVEALPELGGRILTVSSRATERQWIWHNPNIALHAVLHGGSYDDDWAHPAASSCT
jgi:hypothetical protein